MADYKKVIRTPNTLFHNSQSLFVEYNDVIKTPWLILLSFVIQSKNMQELFDLSSFQGMNVADLYEWYINRKHQNFYKDFKLNLEIENINDDFFDNLLSEHMESINEIYSIDTQLKFSNILKVLSEETDNRFIHHIFVYNESDNEYIKNDLQTLYTNSSIQFISGNIDEVLSRRDIPSDSTFVFSDITKINSLIKNNKINYSSILIPNGYRYNFSIDDISKFKIDIDELHKKYTFKLDFFENLQV